MCVSDIQFELFGKGITDSDSGVLFDDGREADDAERFVIIIREDHALHIVRAGAPTVVGLDWIVAVIITSTDKELFRHNRTLSTQGHNPLVFPAKVRVAFGT